MESSSTYQANHPHDPPTKPFEPPRPGIPHRTSSSNYLDALAKRSQSAKSSPNPNSYTSPLSSPDPNTYGSGARTGGDGAGDAGAAPVSMPDGRKNSQGELLKSPAETWRPDWGRKQSWSRQEYKREVQVGKTEGEGKVDEGFSRKV